MQNAHPIMQQALAPFLGAAYQTRGSSMQIETTVAGIPCLAVVTHFHQQPPWRGGAHTAPSDVDYYGYVECDFRICDRRGRPAGWLEKKMDAQDVERITEEITKAFSS